MTTRKPSVAELSYQARVGGQFSAFNFIVCDVDTVSDVIKEVILMFLGVQRQQKTKQKNSRPQRKFWHLDRRRVFKSEKLRNPEAAAVYRKVHHEIRKDMKGVRAT